MYPVCRGSWPDALLTLADKVAADVLAVMDYGNDSYIIHTQSTLPKE